MSQNLMGMLNTKRTHKEQGWKFMETASEIDVKILCQEEGIVYDDFVRVKVTFELLDGYQALFGIWEDG
jgi:hypothetical protein